MYSIDYIYSLLWECVCLCKYIYITKIIREENLGNGDMGGSRGTKTSRVDVDTVLICKLLKYKFVKINTGILGMIVKYN